MELISSPELQKRMSIKRNVFELYEKQTCRTVYVIYVFQVGCEKINMKRKLKWVCPYKSIVIVY